MSQLYFGKYTGHYSINQFALLSTGWIRKVVRKGGRKRKRWKETKYEWGRD